MDFVESAWVMTPRMTPAGQFTNARIAIMESFEDLSVQVIQPCYKTTNQALGTPRQTSKINDNHGVELVAFVIIITKRFIIL